MEKEESYCGSEKRKKKPKNSRGRSMLVRSMNKEASMAVQIKFRREW